MVGGGEGDGACSGVVGGGVGDGTIGLLASPRYSGIEGAGADAAEGVVAGEAPAWAAW